MDVCVFVRPTLIDLLSKAPDGFNRSQVDASGVNMRVQGGTSDLTCCFFTLLHVPTSHNNPSSCTGIQDDTKSRFILFKFTFPSRYHFGLCITSWRWSEPSCTSPGQLSGCFFSNPSVGPSYNHCLSRDFGFTWAGAACQMVPVRGRYGET